MKMTVDEQKRLVVVWLTKTERANAAVNDKIKRFCNAYKMQKYQLAVFYSGNCDLTAYTEDLLLHNRSVSAKQDLERMRKETDA